ncbi:hypothetical protein [Thermostichus vulcanus]|uniref:DUF2203 domain-containing protein n=1 Tax=Thermostichus vulcanus str. 'Rupite' TaxID=2813851 RepID=A0ABT0CAG9_THEVL|nr:hypothetical protein [Thermostichus vulcanus]MCJ2542712.1 hypothetical protein [Thermostichus vulcanus str. 'Rupite']
MTALPQPDPPDPLTQLEHQLSTLQARLADLREMERITQLPPDQWAEIQAEAGQLEQRLQAYLLEVFNPIPATFWQVVRFGGLGLLLGVALQRWLLT